MKSNNFVGKMKQFTAYAWGTLFHPDATFQRLVAEPAANTYATTALLLVGVLYTIATIIGYMNGFGACTLPWLPISAKDYYYYMAFFTIPVFWLTTLIYAAIVQFLSTFFQGKGRFEECVVVAAFGLQITMLPLMFIPELIYFAFSIHNPMPTLELCGTLGLGIAADWIRLIVAVLWQLIVVTIGLKVVQQYSWLKAVVIGLIGFTVYELVFWTYIR